MFCCFSIFLPPPPLFLQSFNCRVKAFHSAGAFLQEAHTLLHTREDTSQLCSLLYTNTHIQVSYSKHCFLRKQLLLSKGDLPSHKVIFFVQTLTGNLSVHPTTIYLTGLQSCKYHNTEGRAQPPKRELRWGEGRAMNTAWVSWQGCLHHDYTDLEVHLPNRAIYSFRMSPVQTANGDTIELALFSNPYKSSSPTERVWLTDRPCSLVWGKRPMAWLFWCCPSALQAALSSLLPVPHNSQLSRSTDAVH